MTKTTQKNLRIVAATLNALLPAPTSKTPNALVPTTTYAYRTFKRRRLYAARAIAADETMTADTAAHITLTIGVEIRTLQEMTGVCEFAFASAFDDEITMQDATRAALLRLALECRNS